SPKRLNEVLTRTGAGAFSPNLLSRRQKLGLEFLSAVWTRTSVPLKVNCWRPGTEFFSVASEAMNLQLGEASKNSEARSAGTESAKGWKSSRCLMNWLILSMTYSEKGEARMLRFPRAR